MKNNFSIEDFLAEVDSMISRAYTFMEREIQRDYTDDTKGAIEWEFKILHLKVIYALESLEQTTLLKMYLEDVATCLSNITATAWDEEGEDWYIPFASVVRRYSNALRITKSNHKKDNRLEILEQILESTGKIIYDFNLRPKNEGEVEKAMYKILSSVFPHTVSKPTVNHILKNFQPDCGIKDLKAAIEYKYVDSSIKMTQWLGQIYEDVKGYSGSEQWKYFYAVIFMTDNFKSNAQVQAEIASHRLPSTWKIFLITGNGADRVKKAQMRMASKIENPTKM